MCVYARDSSRNPNLNTLELDRPQHDRPTACAIAQQYSSTTFVCLRFHIRKEEFGARFNNAILYSFFKILKSETAQLEIASVGEVFVRRTNWPHTSPAVRQTLSYDD